LPVSGTVPAQTVILIRMNLVIDGLIYTKEAHGGISRLFSEILPRMCDLDPSLTVALFTEKGCPLQPLPTHPQIAHRSVPRLDSYLRPRRVWKDVGAKAEQVLRRCCIGSGRSALWHSTFYTLPHKWNGSQVVTFHDLGFQRLPQLFNQPYHEMHRQRMRRCLVEADVVITISKATSEDIQDYYGIDGKKIRVTPLACSTSFRVLESGALPRPVVTERPFILYVGHRMCYKNFDTLLEAYAGWKLRKELDLVVVGGTSLSTQEQQMLVKLGVADQVHSAGHLDDGTLAQFYNQAAAFVCPSLYEGFGIPLLEAMACGCPVVSSRIPACLEVAGDCGVYFDPKSTDDLQRALDIAVGEGRKSSRITKGLEKAREYSWDRTAQQTLDVYREAIGCVKHGGRN
jgi:glycosyltransferase involved in cell wall biosynthesis